MPIHVGNPRRILLIKPSALGDVIQALPVLSALRQRFPEAHLAWVVNRAYAEILEGHPDLDEVVALNRRRGLFAELFAFGNCLGNLFRRRFDLVIDLQGLLRSGVIALAARAPVRIGLASAREGSRWCYTHVVPDDRLTEHAVDRYWKLAEALGLGSVPKRFILPTHADSEAWAQQTLVALPRPVYAVSVGSRWLTKRWPVEHFHELLRRGLTAVGGSVVFVGAPDEAELARQAATGLATPTLNLAGKTTLSQLVSLLRRADVMLSNDSGPLHLATALGRPIVAPYTCTKVSRNGPYGQSHRAVETSVHCAGSYVRTCARLDCMKELTPDRLWPVLEQILSDWSAKRRSA